MADTAPAEPRTLLSDSPCVGICRLEADDRCVACRRSRAELAGWASFTPEQRDAINRRNLPTADTAVRAKLLGQAASGSTASSSP